MGSRSRCRFGCAGWGSWLAKTGLRKLEKGPRPVRQTEPPRRQAVLRLAAHFPESEIISIGQEHRVIAEALVATRRPNQRAVDAGLEFLDMAVRPGDAQRRDEVRLAC